MLIIITSIRSCVCFPVSLWTPSLCGLCSVFLCSTSACCYFQWAQWTFFTLLHFLCGLCYFLLCSYKQDYCNKIPPSSRQACTLFSVVNSITLSSWQLWEMGRWEANSSLSPRLFVAELCQESRPFDKNLMLSSLHHSASWDVRLKQQQNQGRLDEWALPEGLFQMEGNSSDTEITPNDYKHMSGRLFRESSLSEGS